MVKAQRENAGGSILRIWTRDRTTEFRNALLLWYDAQRRELPWRSEPTPYRVWVSEIMLQQTQVRTVIPYFERFVTRFPSIKALAAAQLGEVVTLWAGLGYYRRARDLHRAARILVRQHRGEFPGTLEEAIALPGVGRYTAGAILSIAFNRPEPVVDGNVRRVISRLHGIGRKAVESFFWKQATEWVDGERPSAFNQAVMELGAQVCVPSNPLCLLCPVTAFCRARARGIQHRIPPPRRACKSVALRMSILILRSHGKMLLAPRPVDFVPGAWGLPSVVLGPDEDPGRRARALARRLTGRQLELHSRGTVQHGITCRSITAHVFSGVCPPDALRNPDCHWTDPLEVPDRLTSSLFRKALDALLSVGP